MKKRYIVLIAGAALLAANYYFSQKQETKSDETKTPTVAQVQKKNHTQEPQKSTLEVALESIEDSEALLGEEETKQVNEALTIAFDYLKEFKDLAGVKQTFDNRLSLTSGQMLQTLTTMSIIGYHYDESTLQVYSSDSDNVNQFIFVMSGEDKADLVFAGNFLPSTGQLEIALMEGQPTANPDLDVEEPQLLEEVRKEILKDLEAAKTEK